MVIYANSTVDRVGWGGFCVAECIKRGDVQWHCQKSRVESSRDRGGVERGGKRNTGERGFRISTESTRIEIGHVDFGVCRRLCTDASLRMTWLYGRVVRRRCVV